MNDLSTRTIFIPEGVDVRGLTRDTLNIMDPNNQPQPDDDEKTREFRYNPDYKIHYIKDKEGKYCGIERKINKSDFTLLLELMNEANKLTQNIDIINGCCYFVAGSESCNVKITSKLPDYCNFRFPNLSSQIAQLKFFKKQEPIIFSDDDKYYRCTSGKFLYKVIKNPVEKLADESNGDIHYHGLDEKLFSKYLNNVTSNCIKLGEFEFGSEITSDIKEMINLETLKSINVKKENDNIILERGSIDKGVFIIYPNEIVPEENASQKDIDNYNKGKQKIKELDIDTSLDITWFNFDYTQFKIEFYYSTYMDEKTHIEKEMFLTYINGRINEGKFGLEICGQTFLNSKYCILDI